MLNLAFFLFFLLATPTASFPSLSHFKNNLLGIVNGEYAGDQEWPMMASIQFDELDGTGPYHFCGATVWNANYILTAAHCIYDKKCPTCKAAPRPLKQLLVLLGQTDLSVDSKESRFNVSKMINHPDYDPQEGPIGGHDIAVFKLSRPVDFNEKNKGVQCACVHKESSPVIVRSRCYVVGWGSDGESSNEDTTFSFAWYQEVRVPVRDWSYCKDSMVGNSSGIMCAGYDEGTKDSCQGDSGGPLFCSVTRRRPYEYLQVGVVSYGFGCARAKKPGYYTIVRSYLPWIKEVTGCGGK